MCTLTLPLQWEYNIISKFVEENNWYHINQGVNAIYTRNKSLISAIIWRFHFNRAELYWRNLIFSEQNMRQIKYFQILEKCLCSWKNILEHMQMWHLMRAIDFWYEVWILKIQRNKWLNLILLKNISILRNCKIQNDKPFDDKF